MMKNSKLRFSEYMQNISRSKSFGKFVFIMHGKLHIMKLWSTSLCFLMYSKPRQINLNPYKILFQVNSYYTYSPSQSAPTILVYQVDLIFFRIWNLKKIRSKIWTWKKRGCKNRDIVIQKEKWQPSLFSFWITITHVHILDLIFFKFQTLKKH